jgi:AraC-like DNA-binding protein
VDQRITRALNWIRDRLDEPIALGQAAAVAHLSPSRFRHLFVAQTGISFRAYLLWGRVSNAIVRGMAGESWTVAAAIRLCRFRPSKPHLPADVRRRAIDAGARRVGSDGFARSPDRAVTPCRRSAQTFKPRAVHVLRMRSVDHFRPTSYWSDRP